jgi:hypothetical protein
MLQRIRYVPQVLRLIVLMLVGAAFGSAPTISHSQIEMVERQFNGAILGALCGFVVELVIRQFLPLPQSIPPLRFGPRTFLIVITYAAILMGVIAYNLRHNFPATH